MKIDLRGKAQYRGNVTLPMIPERKQQSFKLLVYSLVLSIPFFSSLSVVVRILLYTPIVPTRHQNLEDHQLCIIRQDW